MDFEEFTKWELNDKRIKNHLRDIQELLSIATKKLDIEDLESIQDRMHLTLKQGLFWLEQKNIDRFIYDLERLSDSICEVLEEKS